MKNPKLEQALAALEQDLVNTLQSWLRTPSVKDEPQPGAPFGGDIRKMLNLALADAERLGFAPRDIDGYAMDVDLGDAAADPAEMLGILAHLDVVPAGDGWQVPPFGAEIHDGRLYGRGTSDDKGPAVAALFAMKAVHDAGLPLKKRVRLVLGCDEESGSACMAYYDKTIGLPHVGFSPDAEYPLINTEKGICRLTLRAALPAEGDCPVPVYRLRAGERPNVIPGLAEAEIGGGAAAKAALAAFAQQTGFPIAVADLPNGHLRVVAEGVSGHASMPELGRNAAARLLLALAAIGAGGGSRTAIAALAKAVGHDTDGTGLGIAGSDGVSGALTCNLGILDLADGVCTATLDVRYPVLFSQEQIIRFASLNLADGGFTVEAGHASAAHHVPASTELVQKLLAVYEDVTGQQGEALAIGGGTYARALKQGVAFGSVFPGDDDLAHQAGEYISIENLIRNTRIFAYAIVALAGA